MGLSFIEAMRSSGLRPRHVVADGKWHRCPTDDKPRKRNGCYLLDVAGERGVWKNYATDLDWNKWSDDCAPVNAAKRASDERRVAELRRREAKRRAECLASMRRYYAGLKRLEGVHPYLEGKRLSVRGCDALRVDGELLVIPMFRAGALMSVQTISPAGEKKYRTGCPIKGASLVLERRASTVTCLVEGFATGLAIFQAIPNARVVVCFDAGNLVTVAQAISASGMHVVCADNDHETAERIGTNPGLEKGRRAAETIGCGLAYPDGIRGSDWADALIEWADRGVSRIRMEILRHARPVFRRAAV